MLASERDKKLIAIILEDYETMQRRIKQYRVSEASFKNDVSQKGQDAFDLVMTPVYRIVEDALHLSDNLMAHFPDYPWDDIRGFRNFVAHGYRNVDRDISWSVVNEDLPDLVSLLKHYLEDAE